MKVPVAGIMGVNLIIVKDFNIIRQSNLGPKEVVITEDKKADDIQSRSLVKTKK